MRNLSVSTIGSVAELEFLDPVHFEGYICGYRDPAQGLAIDTVQITSCQESFVR